MVVMMNHLRSICMVAVVSFVVLFLTSYSTATPIRTRNMCEDLITIAQKQALLAREPIANIEEDLVMYCTKAVPTSQESCYEFIISELPHVMSQIIANDSPRDICKHIEQVKSNKYHLTEKISALIPKESGNETYICNICQLVVYEVELWVTTNESLTVLTEKLQQVCTTVPQTYVAICQFTVQQYLPTFINEVEHDLSPLYSCQLIGYCPESGQTPTKAAKDSNDNRTSRFRGLER